MTDIGLDTLVKEIATLREENRELKRVSAVLFRDNDRLNRAFNKLDKRYWNFRNFGADPYPPA